MELKYKIDRKRIEYIDKEPVYKIVALKDFGKVKAGDVGGFVSSYSNLSQSGNCWISQSSSVVGGASVRDDAIIRNGSVIEGNARIEGNATVNASRISGQTVVNGKSVVETSSIDASFISGTSSLKNANISGNVFVKNSITSDVKIENGCLNGEVFLIDSSSIHSCDLCVCLQSNIKDCVIKNITISRKIVATGNGIGFDIYGMSLNEHLFIPTLIATDPESFVSVRLSSLCHKRRDQNLTIFKNTSRFLSYFRGLSYDSWTSLTKEAYRRYEHNCKNDIIYKSLLKILSEAPFHAYGYYVCAPLLYKKMISFIKEKLGEETPIEKSLLPPDHTAAFVIDAIIFDIIDKLGFISANSNDQDWYKNLLNGDVDKLYASMEKIKKDVDIRYFKKWVDFFSCFFDHVNLDFKNNKISSVGEFSFINNFLIRKAASNIKETFELSLDIDNTFVANFRNYVKNDDRFINIPSHI